MAKKLKGIALCSVLATIIFVVLYNVMSSGVMYALAITMGTISYHFVMRLAVGGIVNGIMQNRADYQKKWYQLCPVEERIYTKLGVKKWKEKMPTYAPELFSVKEKSLEEIIQATCQAEIVHEIIVLLSFLPILAFVWFGEFWVFLFTSIGAAGMDLVFVILQRYNRPRLVKLLERRSRRKHN